MGKWIMPEEITEKELTHQLAAEKIKNRALTQRVKELEKQIDELRDYIRNSLK
jgi:cell division protein FtsB